MDPARWVPATAGGLLALSASTGPGRATDPGDMVRLARAVGADGPARGPARGQAGLSRSRGAPRPTGGEAPQTPRKERNHGVSCTFFLDTGIWGSPVSKKKVQLSSKDPGHVTGKRA